MGDSKAGSTTNLHPQASSSPLLNKFSPSVLTVTVESGNCIWRPLSTSKHLSSMECSLSNKEKASSVMREISISALEEKNCEIKHLKDSLERCVFNKDIELKRLQANIVSLKSQLADRMRQVEVLQEAGCLKDQHIQLLKKMNEELYGKLKETDDSHKCDRSYGTVICQLEVQLQDKKHLTDLEKQVAQLQQELDDMKQKYPPYSGRILKILAEEIDEKHIKQPRGISTADVENNHFYKCCINTKLERSVQTEHDGSTPSVDALAKLVLELKDTQELLEMKKNELTETEATVRNLRQEIEEKRILCANQTILINELKSELSNKVLELEIKFLQDAISDKDTSLALLEMCTSIHQETYMKTVQKEKMKLMEELRNKVKRKLSLFQSEKSDPSTFDGVCTQDQACRAIRTMENRRADFVEYIDKILAVVLEENPNILEGLPRIQQNMGMRPDIAQIASLPELIEELHEEEEDLSSLQNYATLLLQKIMEQAPALLKKLEIG